MRTQRGIGPGSTWALALSGVVGSVAATAVGCSKTTGGIELIVTTDRLSPPADFDDIRLQVSQQVSSGGWNKLWDADYSVGAVPASPDASASQVTLPGTFAVLAGKSADQEVLVTVTAFKGGPTGVPIVLRQAQVQAPTDRVAALWIVLSKACEGQVTTSGVDGGAEGEPESTCAILGESCLPTTGTCGSDVIDSGLQTYVPGEDLDAGVDNEMVNVSSTVCTPTGTQCSGNRVQTCQSNGQWGGAVPCPASTPVCEAGVCGEPPSCPSADAGVTSCGASSESCCVSLEVPGGKYERTYVPGADGGPTDEADPALVSGFRLDKYLVTVGRFRQYVDYVTGSTGAPPANGSGIHTHLNGGLGLANSESPGTYETGWDATRWNANIATGADGGAADAWNTNLVSACTPYNTWTPSAGSNEKLPINCVDWYEAYAFCIWDGGFLPSESEWEYVAAGGGQELEYPWGSMDPGTSNQYAIYGPSKGDCYYPAGTVACTGASNIAPVGAATIGVGTWGQLDMAGNLYEWNLDGYATYVDPCTDCAYLPPVLAPDGGRVVRGGCFNLPKSFLLPSARNAFAPTDRFIGFGFRCARSP